MSTVNIGESVETIPPCAFYDCTSLTSVTIENGVTTIGWGAFEDCTSLTSITIPDSVTTIGRDAFRNCTSLTSIIIPDSVTTIVYEAFYGTAWYDNQPDGLVYAGKVAYKYKGDCPLVVIIKDGTKGIADSAFSGCRSLSGITIPDSVTTIGSYAFYDCCIINITIPGSVIDIGVDAFGYCSTYSGYNSKIECFTIYGYWDSAAKEYAKNNGFYFVSLGEIPITSTTEPTTTVPSITQPSTTVPSTTKPVPTQPTTRPTTVKKTTVTLAKSSATVYRTGKTTIKATVKNGKGKTTYKSSNTKIAKVTSKGVVTGVSKGTTRITVTNNGVKKVFTVKVKNPTLNKNSVYIKKGKTFTLKIAGKIGTAKFTSSNKKIATVNAKGKITAKKKGTVTIKVKTNGITLVCKVKVK